MNKLRPLFYLTFILAVYFGSAWLITSAASPVDSLTVGTFTLDATGAPAVTVKPPTRAGTLAITADIPVIPPGQAIAGQATLSGGQVTIPFPAQAAPPICVANDVTAASPVRRLAVSTASVSFEGVSNHQIEFICTAKTQ